MYCPTETTDGNLRLSAAFFESAAQPAAYAPAAERGPKPAMPVEQKPESTAVWRFWA